MENNFNINTASPDKIAEQLKEDFLPQLLEQVPIVKEAGLLVFFGSRSSGKAILTSDLDLMLFVPQELLILHKTRLMDFSVNHKSPISTNLVFPIAIEVLFSNTGWNNDFLLHSLHEALSVYDPKNILPGIKEKFAEFPPAVLKDKIIFIGLETIKWLQRLERREVVGDPLGIAAIRARLIKLCLIQLHFLHNSFFDAHNLYLDAKHNPQLKNYIPLIDSCLQTLNSANFKINFNCLIDSIQQDLILAGLIEKGFYANWQWWQNPPLYTVATEWL